MRKFFFILFLSSPCFASLQVFTGGVDTAGNAAAAQYYGFMSGMGAGPAAGETGRQQVCAASGTIVSLKVGNNTAPGTGKSRVYTVRANAAPTSCTCTIADTATRCSADCSAAIKPGDLMALEEVPSGTPAKSTTTWTIVFNSSVTNQFWLGGGGTGAPSNSASNWTTVAGIAAVQTSQVAQMVLIGSTGTLSNFYVNTTTATGSGTKTYTSTIQLNGANTAMTCTLLNANVFNCSDQAHTLRVKPGDVIDIIGSPSNTPAVGIMHYGVMFTPDQKGEMFFPAGRVAADSTSGTNNRNVQTSNATNIGSEGQAQQLLQSSTMQMVITGLFAATDVAPGAAASGKKYDVLYRVNQATKLTATLLESTTSVGVTGSVPINDWDTHAIQIVPANTPTAARVRTAVRYMVRQRRIAVEGM